ncbi:MAG: peptidylprolyl isomerase [Gammaproteobacteria bacterium]|nr:MAG: peptidylprolyl isomerase [Gammaproteobacteria bacterium]
MTISQNSAVFFNYTLTDKDGNVLDQTPEGQSLAYLHGHNNIIPGLEKQLEGKSAGDKLTAIVNPAEAYGEHQPEAIHQVSRQQFQGVDEVEVGMQFHSQTENGQMMQISVVNVSDDTITIDANHPLAGKQLHFNVEIIEVRDATEEEIAHGHIHGQGGVQH